MRRNLLIVLFLLIASASSFAQKSGTIKKSEPLKGEKKHKMTDTVGVVNGIPVLLYDYRGILSEIIHSAARDSIVREDEFSKYVDAAWDRVVEGIIIEQEIDKRKLRMSNEQVKESIIIDPPDFIAQQFRDSAGVVNKEHLRMAMNDALNDSAITILIGGQRDELEHKALIKALFPKCSSDAEAKKEFEAWLKKAKSKARIDDRRLAFGYY